MSGSKGMNRKDAKTQRMLLSSVFATIKVSVLPVNSFTGIAFEWSCHKPKTQSK